MATHVLVKHIAADLSMGIAYQMSTPIRDFEGDVIGLDDSRVGVDADMDVLEWMIQCRFEWLAAHGPYTPLLGNTGDAGSDDDDGDDGVVGQHCFRELTAAEWRDARNSDPTLVRSHTDPRFMWSRTLAFIQRRLLAQRVSAVRLIPVVFFNDAPQSPSLTTSYGIACTICGRAKNVGFDLDLVTGSGDDRTTEAFWEIFLDQSLSVHSGPRAAHSPSCFSHHHSSSSDDSDSDTEADSDMGSDTVDE